MIEHLFFYWVLLIISLAAALSGYLAYVYKKTKYYLHMMQLNSYMNDRFYRWFKGQRGRKIAKREFFTLLPVVLLFLMPQPEVIYFCFVMLITAVIYWLLFFGFKKQPQKKTLVMTDRAKRLFVKAFGLFVLLAVLFVAGLFSGIGIPFAILLLVLTAAVIFDFAVVIFANFVLQPIEKHINKNFYLEAQRIIRELPGLTTIGITGSFGKTSSKLIMEQILSEGFMTLATPESYNTPMGVTRIIRENLRPIHEVFIAEMGAKKPGDIKELCDLVAPKIGVLTAIGEQHLETFGSQQAIIDTKLELIESLPADGMAVLNLDNHLIKENAHRSPCRVVGYGVDTKTDYTADEFSYGSTGCSFTVHTPAGESITLVSRLLGKHNIYNILAAVAVAHQMGLGLDKIKRAVGRIQPLQHRLQLLKNPQGFDIIDDAFNSNPQGAEAALEVLASFKSGKRILLTPGMVELGDKQYELNKEFALQAAGMCDYIILVGEKHTLPLQDGLEEAGYPKENYYVATGLNDAWRQLLTFAKPGDIVLLENDLPDTYNE